MSYFAYNGVSFNYILTQSVTQGPEYDPDRTDQLYTNLRVEVQSVINAALLPATVGEAPAATVARIRHLLTAPRRPLIYSVGGVNLINLPDGLDDANGPFPEPNALTITQLSPATFIVKFAVVVRLTDCGTSPPGYLSNRWELTESYDRDWYATKRTSGLLIVSSRGINGPDDLRGLVTPGIDPSFRRESAEYKVAPDGLKYRYSFVDKQLAKVPPFPATTMRGRQVESTTTFGGKRLGQVNMTLAGPPTVATRDLMNAAIRLAMARVWASGPLVGANNRLLINGSISEPLDDDKNEVSIDLKYQMKPVTARQNGQQPAQGLAIGAIGDGMLNNGYQGGVTTGGGKIVNNVPSEQGRPTAALSMFASWLGQPLAGSDPKRGIAPPLRGLTAGITLVAAALNDPCGSEVQLDTGDRGNNVLVGTTANGATVSISTMSTSELPPDDTQALYTDDNLPGVYDTWVCTAHYHLDTGQDVLPPASPTGTGKLIQVHGPVRTLRLEWDASRVGSEPDIPPEVHPDKNWVLITSDVSPASSEPAADGVSMKYVRTGVYFYKAIDPLAVKYTHPVPPYVDATLVADSMSFQGDWAPGGGVSILRGGPAD